MFHAGQALRLPPNQRSPVSLLARVMAADGDHRDGKTMHHRGAEHDEADDGPDDLDGALVRRMRRRMRKRFGGRRLQLGAGFDGQEEGAETHGAEVAAEEGLAVGADVRDPAFEGQHDWDAADDEDEGEKGE